MAKRIVVSGTFSWLAAGSTAIDSDKISQNKGVHQGKLIGHKVTVSDNTANRTITLKVLDQDGDVIYTSGNLAEAVTTVTMGLDIPLVEQEVVRITPSGAPSTGGMAVTNVVLYYHPDPENEM